MRFITIFVQIRVHIRRQPIGKVLLVREQVCGGELVINKLGPLTGSYLNTMKLKHWYLAPSLVTDESTGVPEMSPFDFSPTQPLTPWADLPSARMRQSWTKNRTAIQTCSGAPSTSRLWLVAEKHDVKYSQTVENASNYPTCGIYVEVSVLNNASSKQGSILFGFVLRNAAHIVINMPCIFLYSDGDLRKQNVQSPCVHRIQAYSGTNK